MMINMRLLEAALLLKCVEDAAGRFEQRVGHMDADRTSKEMRRILNKEVAFNQDVVESGLAAMRELEGVRGFQTIDSMTYLELANKLAPRGYYFNKKYGVFEKKGK